MISPLGVMLADYHAALVAYLDVFISAFCAKMTPPAVALFMLSVMLPAIRASRDPNAWLDYTPLILRAMFLFAFSTSADAVNLWLRDYVFLGVSDWLVTVLASLGGDKIVPVGGLTATGAALNAIWAQSWQVIGEAQKTLGPVGRLAAGGATDGYGLSAAFFIASMAVLYVLAETSLTVLVGSSPLIFALGMVPLPVFQQLPWKWAGKAMSLLLLIFFGMFVLQIVLFVERALMFKFIAELQAINAAPSVTGWSITGEAVTNAPMGATSQVAAAFSSAVQILASMVAVLFVGFVLMLGVPAMAYTFGGGHAMSTSLATAGVALGARWAAMKAAGVMRGAGAPPPVPAAPNLALAATPDASFWQGAPAAPPALPPPPPAERRR